MADARKGRTRPSLLHIERQPSKRSPSRFRIKLGSGVRYSARKSVYRVVEKLLIECSRLTYKRPPGDISYNKCKTL